MKSLTITPLWFENDHGTRYLVTKVEFFGYERRRRPKLWFSAPDITVEQLCDEVAHKFRADKVSFQPPLFSLSTKEYHAADWF